MVRAGCTFQETSRDLGAYSPADDKHCHGWGSGSLDLECERNEATSESLGESGAENAERILGLDFREVEGPHHRGAAVEEQGFEGGSEADEGRSCDCVGAVAVSYDPATSDHDAKEEKSFEGRKSCDAIEEGRHIDGV